LDTSIRRAKSPATTPTTRAATAATIATPIVLASLISKQAEQKAGSASLGFERKAGDTRPRAGSTYALV
jgi:hypothetical protein